MKIITRFVGLYIAVCFGSAGASAQSSTAPVGYLIYSFPAAASTTKDFISAPLTLPKTYIGTTSAVEANTITVNAADWTTNQFADNPYHVLVTSGAQAGRTLPVLSNTATQLTVDTTDDSAETTDLTTPGFAFNAGDSFEIVADYTLGNLFGSANATADSIGLWNPANGVFEYYRFNADIHHWVKDGADPAADYTNFAIAPSAAIAVVRNAGRAAGQMVLSGSVATIAPLLKLPGNDSTLYAGTSAPVDMTLSQVNLGANWKKSNSPLKADALSVYNMPHAKWKTFYQSKSGSWMKSGVAASKDGVSLPAGGAVAFFKRRAVSGSASFFSVPLPYTQ